MHSKMELGEKWARETTICPENHNMETLEIKYKYGQTTT